MSSRGGSRIGAGRKPAPYKTIVISVRIPTELSHQISSLIKKTISEWKAQTNLIAKPH
jgi:hypothetical protein